MALAEIKAALGINRVVWIDDVFGEPLVDLSLLAREYPEVRDSFPELAAAFDTEGFGDVDAAIQQVVNDLDDTRRKELQVALLQIDAAKSRSTELALGTIDAACSELGVLAEDRWTFEKADSQLIDGDGNDADVAYLIDLKEGKVSDRRGIEILSQLRVNNSNGIAFILTHEATVEGEAAVEISLEGEIDNAADFAPCITVISKERLTADGIDIGEALSVALKRAGLRKVLHRVLNAASDRAAQAYTLTAKALLKIEPERLERYVYERGRVEGVSELSVVERALTAGASLEMRTFFGTDTVIHQAVQALRSLQAIPLDNKPFDAGPILSDLRNAEIWDGASVINPSLTPLANGDVFRFDDMEPGAPNSPKLFVLLGQPCDIMIRPDGKRQTEVAMMVPLHECADDGAPLPDPNDADEDDVSKAPELPFRLNGKRYKLYLRTLAYVRLAVLDLACFRADGCISVHVGHSAPETLLAGSRAVYRERTTPADHSLLGPVPPVSPTGMRPPVDDQLLLTMSDTKPWDRVRVGRRLAPFKPSPTQPLEPLPDRVTWHLRRDGRIRAPYSSFLLERALKTLGRQAFDLDYTKD